MLGGVRGDASQEFANITRRKRSSNLCRGDLTRLLHLLINVGKLRGERTTLPSREWDTLGHDAKGPLGEFSAFLAQDGQVFLRRCRLTWSVERSEEHTSELQS